jgi:hypothetical protein
VWWVGSKEGEVYLGTRKVQLRVGSELVLSESVADAADGLQHLAAALQAQPKRRRFRIGLGSGLCRPFMLPEVAGMGANLGANKGGKDDWMLVAESLAEEATGLSGPCQVWLDGEQEPPGLAVAMPKALMDQVFEVLPPRRIQSISPWWSQALKVHAKRNKTSNALAVSDSDGLTLLLADAQRFVHAQSYATQAAHQEDKMAEEGALLDRALLAANWPTETVPIVRLGHTGAQRMVFGPEGQE